MPLDYSHEHTSRQIMRVDSIKVPIRPDAEGVSEEALAAALAALNLTESPDVINNFVTNELFVTELVENNTFITELTENNTFVTNIDARVTNVMLTAGRVKDTFLGNLLTRSIAYVIDGAGAAITTGIKGDIEVPFPCTITAWRVFADVSGSIAVGIWKDTYANFPPLVGDLIATPTITTATKAQTTGLSLAVAAGDILRFNVDSATTITRATVSLTVTVTT